MQNHIPANARRRGLSRTRHDQLGGETIEFVLFLIPFFIVCFLIIDMAVVMFNQSVVNHAARYGTRNGTLYWVDPVEDPALPRDTNSTHYIRVKADMIATAVDYYVDNVLINPGGNDVGLTITPAANIVWSDLPGGTISVRLNYPHDFFAVNRLLSVADWTLGSDTRLHTEYDR
jgi:hypothetical protein